MSSVGFIDVPIRYSVFNVMVLSISPPAQMLLLNMLFLSFTEFGLIGDCLYKIYYYPLRIVF